MHKAVDTLTLEGSVANQTLTLLDSEGTILKIYPMSTSAFGLGTEVGSHKTPTGIFEICEKIGHGEPLWTVFRGRKPVEDISPEEARSNEGNDLITSRILRLEGLEEHNSNTKERYVYIHGTNHESKLGTPASRGCLRMRNDDITELFEIIPVGTKVIIS